ncbi:transposase [Amycolatopsis halotolerans]|uniref:Transposase n=1 Tax=Amycolatopsis halotolerans TaxID=330083 RepID=A0ABV7QK20_9PSEU
MLILNERRLRAVLAEYVRHYNVDGRTVLASFAHPGPSTPVADLNTQRIKRQRLLGGPINEYERAA